MTRAIVEASEEVLVRALLLADEIVWVCLVVRRFLAVR